MRVEQIGDCTLYLGDCLEVMPGLDPVDAVVTDPPYNFSTASSGSKHSLWPDAVNSAFWFSAVFSAFRSVIGPTRPGVVWQFLNWKTFIPLQKAVWDAGLKFDSLLVWDKGGLGCGGIVGLRPSYELVAFVAINGASLSNRGLADVWRFPFSAAARHTGHPAEKPVALMEKIVKESPPQIVLDPFMGSGTTGVACVKLGRRFIGIELEEKYFDIAVKRIEDAYRQPDLFIEPPAKAEQLEAAL